MNASRRDTSSAADSAQRLVIGFVGAWILSMIALPIARWIWGDAVIPFAATAGVVFQFAAVIVILHEAWPRKRVLVTVALIAVLTWGAEWLGSMTGFPFGVYHYTELLQPQFLGVPLLIPPAWVMTLVPSWAVAQVILGYNDGTLRQRIVFALLSGAAMTAWDLYLDPQMAGWGFWVWESHGAYFGIPLINFAGWFAVASLVTFIVRPLRVPVAPLLGIYGVIWAFQAIGLGVFWGQPGPALFGFLAMGTLLFLAVNKARQTLWMR